MMLLSLLYIQNTFGCSFDASNISDSLDNCFSEWTQVVSPSWDLEVSRGGWFNNFILGWVESISGILALATVGVIAYGSFMFTISTWEDDKITKAKDIIKWGIIGFIGILTANALIELIINILYGI